MRLLVLRKLIQPSQHRGQNAVAAAWGARFKRVYGIRALAVQLAAGKRLRYTTYGRVLAISGTAASPVRLACCGPRWYVVRPSFRNSKLSSGESDILKRSRSPGAMVPASTIASKLRIFFQYSLP